MDKEGWLVRTYRIHPQEVTRMRVEIQIEPGRKDPYAVLHIARLTPSLQAAVALLEKECEETIFSAQRDGISVLGYFLGLHVLRANLSHRLFPGRARLSGSDCESVSQTCRRVHYRRNCLRKHKYRLYAGKALPRPADRYSFHGWNGNLFSDRLLSGMDSRTAELEPGILCRHWYPELCGNMDGFLSL